MGDGGEGSAWLQERAEVLKAVALLEQAVQDVRGDMGTMRGAIGELLQEMKGQGRDWSGLQADYQQRMQRLESIRMTVKGNTQRLDNVERVLERLKMVNRAVVWVGVAFGGSIVALIWALIVGQAQVVFR